MSDLLSPGDSAPATAVSVPSAWPRVLTSADAQRAGGAGDLGDLKEILGIVRRRRWLVLFFAATSAGIADAPRDNIGSSYTVDPVLSQIQVLKSREVAAEAVRRQPLGLVVYPEG